MNRQIIRKKVSELKTRANVRKLMPGEDTLRRLGKSLRQRQQTPLEIDGEDYVIDGHLRLAAALLEGIEELECIIDHGEATPDQIATRQFISAEHRANLADYDKAAVIRDTKLANPGMTNKQIADEILFIDPPRMTAFLSLWDCIPEVIEAAAAGKLSCGQWYEIKKSPDQAFTLGKLLSGATRDEVARQAKKARNASTTAVRSSRIKVPLQSGQVVTVAGDGVSLEDAIEAAGEAMKLMKAAIAKGLNAKTAMNVWRDVAAAG